MRQGSFLLAVGVALALTPAVGATSLKPRVKAVNGEVQALGMDGAIVVYGVKPEGECGGKVLFWNVQTNGGGVVSGKRTCEANSTSTGAGITEVAVAAAARRYAWIVNQGGNSESDDYLYTSCPRRSRRSGTSGWLSARVTSTPANWTVTGSKASPATDASLP